MKKTIIVSVFFATAILFSACDTKPKQEQEPQAEAKAGIVTETFTNKKYGFSITYPADVFRVDEKADTKAGDYNVLTSADGLAKLHIFVGNLAATQTTGDRLQQAFDDDVKPRGKRELILKSFGTTDYTLNGYENRTIFQQKTIVHEGKIATAILYYENEVKDDYAPMLRPIFLSFK